jgi:predicted DNA-binding transcriptional regulator AlpA
MKSPDINQQDLQHPPIAAENDCILRIKGVQHLSGLGRTATYELVSRPEFPEAIPLTKSARGWWRSEVLDYLDGLRVSGNRK